MAFPILAVMALAQAGISAAKGVQQSNLANKINPKYKPYKTSEYAKQRLGMAQQMYGGRMAGAGRLEDSIYTQQANTNAAINRNATSGSQALSLAGAVQGQTNQSLGDLASMEAQDKFNRGQNLNAAYEGMIHEGEKEYDDMMMKYRDDVAAKTALRASSAQNWGNAMNGAMSAVGGLTGGGGMMGSITGAAANRTSIQEITPIGGSINTGLTTSRMPMQAYNSVNPYLLNPMVRNGFNTNRPLGPARFNQFTGRWE